MKIAIISPGVGIHEDYKKGDLLGTEYQIFGLSRALIKQGHEVFIIRRWNNSTEEEVKGIKIINIDIPKRFLPKHMIQVLFSRKAAEKIEYIKPDILLLTAKYSSYGVLKSKIPKVYTTHTIPRELMPNENKTINKYHPTIFVEKKIYSNSEYIAALNSEIKQYLKSKGFRAVFIPNAIDIAEYNFNISKDSRYVLFGGRLVKSKGVHFLVRAYSLLPDNLQKEYKLKIIGEGPEKENIRKLALKLRIYDRVEFVPWLRKNEFTKEISEASVLVLPSLFECMPVTVLESMALGTPVIASDIPGPRDIITHEYDGLLFTPRNILDLKEYLELLLGDRKLQKKIASNARKTIERQYTFEKVAYEYSKLFKKIINETAKKEGMHNGKVICLGN